jgi:hypothetical protein
MRTLMSKPADAPNIFASWRETRNAISVVNITSSEKCLDDTATSGMRQLAEMNAMEPF